MRNFYASLNFSSFTVSLAQTAFPPTILEPNNPQPSSGMGVAEAAILITFRVVFLVLCILVVNYNMKKRKICCYARS